MNALMKTLMAGALLAVSAPFAYADSINANVTASGTQDVTFTSSTIQLPGDGSASIGGTVNGSALPDGTSLYFDSNTLTFVPGGSLSSPLLIASFGGNGLGSGFNFYVTSENPVYSSAGGYTTLQITGTGYFNATGFDDTPATFILQASYSPNQAIGSLTSFNTNSTSIAPTPEPSSLLLLGSGLVGTAGMMLRRRRTV